MPQGQKTALGGGVWFSSCFRQGLLFVNEYARLSDLWVSGILHLLSYRRQFWDYRHVLLCPVLCGY